MKYESIYNEYKSSCYNDIMSINEVQFIKYEISTKQQQNNNRRVANINKLLEKVEEREGWTVGTVWSFM